MTIFDFLFILCFLAAAIVLVLTAITAVRGYRGKALARLRKLGICTAIYMAVLVARGLIYTHEGRFPIGSFIIGQNPWFHGPPVVELK